MNLLLFFLIHLPSGCHSEFWRRYGHSSIIARDWLYIDGGQIAFTRRNYVAENSTIGIDLSKDWTNTSLTPIYTERFSKLPSLNKEPFGLMIKKNIIYSFGGNNVEMKYKNVSDSIRGFIPDGKGSGKWIEVLGPVSEKPFPADILSPSSGMYISDNNDAYYLEGWISSSTTPNGPDQRHRNTGMLRINIENLAITKSSGPDPFFDYGALVDVPIYGSNGVLLALGGINQERDVINLNSINVFDKKEDKWYSQLAEGEIPLPRELFCAVGVYEQGRTSFEIIIHGGIIFHFGSSSYPETAEVYVLSLPAFRWFRANHTSDFSRGGHTCHATKTRQMIMIGGQIPSYAGPLQFEFDKTSPQDPWSQGIAVFDMTALKFQDTYRSKADPYEPPYVVQQYYNKSKSKYPSLWTSPELQAIFEDNNPPQETSVSPTLAPQSSSHSHLGRGALAALIVAGIAGSFLCGVIGIYMMEKARKREQTKIAELPSSASQTSLLNGFEEPSHHEMSTEREPSEIMNERSDRAGLPDSCTRPPVELPTD